MSQVASTIDADAVMSAHGKTFYRAARLLPRSVRGDVVSLYAFCRHVDDITDESPCSIAERRSSLDRLSTALESGDSAQLLSTGWPLASRGQMPQAAALLVRTAAADLQQQQPQTQNDLLQYAFGVAGTVGVMMANVLRAEPSGMSSAVALGMAMQLTNISRDVAQDLQQGRVYLPQDWVAASAVRGALLHGNAADAAVVVAATHRTLQLADALYETAYDGIACLPWRVRWSILAAALCYRAIGVRVQRNVPLSWKRRTVVGSGSKLALVALAALRLLLPRFRRQREAKTPPELLGAEANRFAVGCEVAG